MKTIGKLDWAFSAGKIPFENNGEEPEFISHDKIAVLNTSEDEAEISMSIFYEDEKSCGNYKVKIKPRRLRKIKFNDLIDPTAIRLGRNFSCLIQSTVPVVIQFSRMNTGLASNAEMTTIAFPVDD